MKSKGDRITEAYEGGFELYRTFKMLFKVQTLRSQMWQNVESWLNQVVVLYSVFELFQKNRRKEEGAGRTEGDTWRRPVFRN